MLLIVVVIILIVILLVQLRIKDDVLEYLNESEFSTYKSNNELIQEYDARQLLDAYPTLRLLKNPETGELYMMGPDGPSGKSGDQGPPGHLLFKKKENVTHEYCPIFPEVEENVPEKCPTENVPFQPIINIDINAKSRRSIDANEPILGYEKLVGMDTKCINHSFMNNFAFTNLYQNGDPSGDKKIAMDVDCMKIAEMKMPVYEEAVELMY